MKKVLFAISAIVFLAVSCQKEVLDNSSEKSTESSKTVDNPLNTITVKMDGGTRLGIDESNKPFFEEEDVVFGWDSQDKYTYKCTSVGEGVATFTKTSDYAPSATEGTKVNLVYAKGHENTALSDNRELTIDISSQDATEFKDLPLVMTASGTVNSDGKCIMSFDNETSVINVKNCKSGSSASNKFNCYGVNLFPEMTLSIGTDGKFVKTVGNSPRTIINTAQYTIGEDQSFSFWLATFKTPDNVERKLYLGINASTGWEYKYATNSITIASSKVLKLEDKEFSAVYAKIGDVPYSTLKDAFADADGMAQPCTVKLIRDWKNSSQEIKVTNTEGVTLDLNGKKLTISKGNRITPDGGKLIIDDSENKGNGVITNDNGTYRLFSYTSGALTVKSGKIYPKKLETGTPTPVIYVGGGTFNMEGGEISTENQAASLSFGGDSETAASITGGTITSNYAGANNALLINNANATITVDGPDVSIGAPGTPTSQAKTAIVQLTSGRLILNNGKIGGNEVKIEGGDGYNGDPSAIQIKDGTFEMTGGTLIAQRHAIIFTGSGTATISSDGFLRSTKKGSAYYLIRFEEGSTNTLNVNDGYLYSYSTSPMFDALETGSQVNISKGWFNKDLQYPGINITGSLSELPSETKYKGYTFTYEVK